MPHLSIPTTLCALLLAPGLVPCQDTALGTPASPRPTSPRLADPTGPWLVGTQTFHWVDSKREEVLTGKKGDKRELMVQVWYPAAKRKKDEPIPETWRHHYVPGYETMKPLLQTQYGDYAEQFGNLLVPAKLDAPLIKSPRLLPMVLFSHGMRTARFYYSTQALELASQGYIVVCPDHSYDVEGVAFPDKRLVRGIYENEKAKKAVDAVFKTQDGRIRIWGEDLSFLLDRMLKNRDKGFAFRGRVDGKHIASVGHCFGGQGALEIGMLDKRIRAVVAQNAWPPSGSVRKKGLNKPVLMLYAQTDTAEEGLIEKGVPKEQIQKLKTAYVAEQKKGLQAITRQGLQVRIHGAKHMSFSDEFLIREWMAKDPLLERVTLDPDDHLRLAMAYTVAFLDRELRGRKPELLVGDKHQGVDFEDLSEKKRSKKRRRE